MPEISIIVPVYNVEKYLPRCIDSILAQTFTDFELILVDDGSPDNCGAICDEYAARDGRVRVIHKENGGVSSARNAGLDIACGEYVTFCDGDDYYLANWLEKLLSSAKENNADMVVANYQSVNEKGKIINKSSRPARKYLISDKEMLDRYLICQVLFNGGVWSSCSCLFCRRIIKQHELRFCEIINHYEDRDFNAVYTLYCKRINWIDYNGYCYVIHDDSASHSVNEICLFDMVNESSISIGTRYFQMFPGKRAEKVFSVIHFALMYAEYNRLIYHFQGKHFDALPREIKLINNKQWNNRWSRMLLLSWSIFKDYLNSNLTDKDLIIIARYSIHRQPWLFKIESAITYKLHL